MVLNKTFLNKQSIEDYDQKTLQTKLGYYALQIEVIQQTPRNCEKFYIRSVFWSNNFSGVEMLSEQLKQFNSFLLLNKGLQQITRQGHLTSIKIVLKRIEVENPTNLELQEHIIWMHSKSYSHSHITNTIKAIEYFTEFNGNPLKIAKTRRPKKLIENYLTEAEIGAMIREAKDIREKAMIVFLAFSGVRNLEFCNVKVKDIDFGNNSVFIRQGKFSKDRRVNIGHSGINVLIKYIMDCNKKQEEYLFTTIKNNNKHCTSDLRKFINVLAKKTKIEKRVYPHLFRHSLSTNLILRGASILLVKEQLGHTDIQTTMNYIQRLPIHIIKTQYEYHVPAYL